MSREKSDRPVLHGLLALATVALLLGLLAGVAIIVGTKVVGLGGGSGSDTASDIGAGATLYIPSRTPTEASTGPSITLAPAEDGGTLVTELPSATATPTTGITVTAAQASVAAMQQIDLTGSYPGGDGAILQVERFDGSNWVQFPVTVSVSGETFSTYVQTSQAGENKFRLIDTDTQATSNEVVVKVG